MRSDFLSLSLLLLRLDVDRIRQFTVMNIRRLMLLLPSCQLYSLARNAHDMLHLLRSLARSLLRSFININYLR